MQIETRLSDQLANYLDLVTTQTKLTAANMANLDTPGYRTLGIDFGAEMRSRLSALDRGVASPHSEIYQIQGLIERADGNDVSVDRESLNLAEAQLQFKTGIVLLRSEFQRVMDAIHADGK